jgi:hypothetical protein
MGVQNPKKISILLITLLSLAGSFPAVGQGNSGVDDLDARINRMTRRVNFGLKQGFIQQDQADKLQNDLKDIGMQAASARKANGGQLKPTDLTGFESRLNQNSNLIQSYNRAGSRKTAAPNATGPAWVKGDDGAQDPRMLKRRMKAQEQKQLQQEDAAIMQVKEQQQQQYEKEMLEKLGSQRPTILKNKQDLDQIRQNTGAN